MNNGVVIHSVKEDYIVKEPKLLHSCINSSIVELYELKRKIKEANERAIKSGFFIRGKVPIGFQLNETQGTNRLLRKKYLTLDSRFKTINYIARMTNRKTIANRLKKNNITPKELAHFKKNKARCMRLVRNSQRNLSINKLNTINPTEIDVISNMFDKLYV